ncbi:hypothetical protein CEXT_595141 [Caerostris extrusa]|uniref:Uncharacterized protein n=1 Tax=Caerostris extrusa TaxID=172846 RepID=A0AAV4PMN6_CAEEX|nr:hypothetical protein CEXT_595141 [Caerostris extrusa]
MLPRCGWLAARDWTRSGFSLFKENLFWGGGGITKSEDKSIDDDDSSSCSSNLSNSIKTVYLNCPAAVTVTHLKN